MTRVIHTADTHIGYRQYHSDERRRDFLRAFEHLIDDAIDDEVDAIVHAGDLFHDKRPDLRDLQGTIAALARLRAADIPVYGIVGNHERKRETQWLDLFADLGLAIRLGPSPTLVDDVALYGLDFDPGRERRTQPAFEPAEDANYHVLVGHGLIEAVPHGDWDIASFLDSATVSFDAVLLGDHHEHELEYVGETAITYPGSTERVSVDERTDRGYNVVRFDDGVAVNHRSLPETRPFEYIDIDLAAGEGLPYVKQRIEEHELTDCVAIVTIEGDGDAIAPAAIEEHARECGALVARVRDRRETDDEETDMAVEFADPDRAVERALAETSFTTAARELDDIVRDESVPDSGVRERARARLETLIKEDADALVTEPIPAEPTPATEDGTSVADDADGAADVISTEDGSDPPTDDDVTATSADDPKPAETTTAGEESGQASMEDYL